MVGVRKRNLHRLSVVDSSLTAVVVGRKLHHEPQLAVFAGESCLAFLASAATHQNATHSCALHDACSDGRSCLFTAERIQVPGHNSPCVECGLIGTSPVEWSSADK